MCSDRTATRVPPWNRADPYPYYEQRRRDGDVVWEESINAWLVLGYRAAVQVLAGQEWTSDPRANPAMRAGLASFGFDLVNRAMVFADGTDHARLRRSVRDTFTPRAIGELATGVAAIAADVVGYAHAGTAIDFMADIASLLPIAVIGEWMDLTPATSALLLDNSAAIIRMLDGLSESAVAEAGMAAFATLITEFLPLAADRRTHPGADLLSLMAADHQIDLEDVVINAILIAIAGHDTTANILGAAMIRLLTAGPSGTRIADSVDPEDPSLITELLRLDGVQTAMMRTAKRSHTISGVRITTGQQALIVLGAANRDPSIFDEPHQLRLNRGGPPPVAFGYGPHHCLGSALARLEIGAVLREILTRRPVLAGPVVWREERTSRGLSRVPIIFTL